jgi:hypothetical protein
MQAELNSMAMNIDANALHLSVNPSQLGLS